MKVLLADDEADVRELLVASFEAQGHEVFAFADGRKALDAVPLKKPDLVLLDVMMPKVTGWQVCNKLRAEEETKKIPIIILTAKGTGMDELMSAEAGADLYLAKPFDPLDVVAQAEKLVREKGK